MFYVFEFNRDEPGQGDGAATELVVLGHVFVEAESVQAGAQLAEKHRRKGERMVHATNLLDLGDLPLNERLTDW